MPSKRRIARFPRRSMPAPTAGLQGVAGSFRRPRCDRRPPRTMVFLEAWECTMSISTTRPSLGGGEAAGQARGAAACESAELACSWPFLMAGIRHDALHTDSSFAKQPGSGRPAPTQRATKLGGKAATSRRAL